jgi:hypothetical protein
MGVARQFIPVFGGTDEWPASFPLTAQSITRSAVGETDMVDDPKRSPYRSSGECVSSDYS